MLVPAQTVEQKKPSEADDKLRKEAVAFLRETLADVNSMRSPENRITFTSELAALMWFHDEREARAMYVGVITDFKEVLTKYDSQMNALTTPAEDSDIHSGGFMSFLAEPTDRSRLLRRYLTALGVRQQIAMSMAEHDPDLALGFYYDSLSAVTNAEFLQQHQARDSHFEHQLLTQLAEKSPASAAKGAIRSLDNGVTGQHVELLKKIHAKDPEKAADFGAAIIDRLEQGPGPGPMQNEMMLSTIGSLISFGEETLEASRKPGGKRAVYSMSQLRELAEVIAQRLLNGTAEDAFIDSSHLAAVKKYLPGRAAQIQVKLRSAVLVGSSTNSKATNSAPIEEYDEDLIPAKSSNSNSNTDNPVEREKQERLEREKKMLEDVESIGSKQLPKEERERIVTQARKIIMQGSSRDKKVTSLIMLASQVAKAGDKELASEIMRDAEKLVPAPKNYRDFLLSWMLASGYATTDPAKAFPLLEETIGRANDTIGAFIKVGEFMDAAEEMIQDGEVQVGAFGGQMVRGLTKELVSADMTIDVLAKADFGKTKNLVGRFDRIEIRVLAKMMVLRAVLSPKAVPVGPSSS